MLASGWLIMAVLPRQRTDLPPMAGMMSERAGPLVVS
jgi:hypothetical protein